LLVDDAGFAHFLVKIIALASALADASEHGETAVALRDVIDQFHDHDRLADAGPAERADLAAFRKRADEIDDFDAGLENLSRGVLLDQRRRRTMNRITLGERNRTAIVDRIAGDVENPSERPLSYRHCNRA